jgi:hypothetical protein
MIRSMSSSLMKLMAAAAVTFLAACATSQPPVNAGIEGTGKTEKVAGIEGTGKPDQVAGIEGTGKPAQVAGIEGTGKPGQVAGIEGTGKGFGVVASGEVTALGSIVVHNIDFALNGATVTIENRSGAPADLEVGQVVNLVGELDPRTGFGRASKVEYASDLAGPISWIDPVADRAIVLGQQVRFNDVGRRTQFEQRAGFGSAASLGVGSVVEISGFYDSNGVLSARRVASRAAGKPLVISGIARNIDSAARRLEINTTRIDFATLAVTPQEGDELRIEAIAANDGMLVATRIDQRKRVLEARDGGVVMLEGWASLGGVAGQVIVDGYRVRTAINSPLEADARERRFVRVIGTAHGADVESLRAMSLDSAGSAPATPDLNCAALSDAAALACRAQGAPAAAEPQKAASSRSWEFRHFYIGADLGMSDYEIEDGGLFEDEYKHDATGTSWGVRTGWSFRRYFGIEVGYISNGTVSYRLDQEDCYPTDGDCSPHDGEGSSSATYVGFQGRFPIGKRFLLGAIAGYSETKSLVTRDYDDPLRTDERFSDSGPGFLFGAELTFEVNQAMDLSLSARQNSAFDVGDLFNTADATSLTIGVRARF